MSLFSLSNIALIVLFIYSNVLTIHSRGWSKRLSQKFEIVGSDTNLRYNSYLKIDLQGKDVQKLIYIWL